MPGSPPASLSIIIVSWNVRDLLYSCLATLQAGPDIALQDHDDKGKIATEVIVVDNGSADGTVETVTSRFPWVQVIANHDNRGFTRANNQGLASSVGTYVLFLNPDTEVVGPALATMVQYLESHPTVGAVGPQLRYADGSLQSSRRRFPTFAMALMESTPLAWHLPERLNPWARRYRLEDRPVRFDRAEQVDWVVGAALMTRRTVLDQIGGFDEGFFMYSEELDWCRRAVTAGWRIVYLPTAIIIHHEGKSSEQVVAARHIRFQTSKVRYFRKHHGVAAGLALRNFLLVSFALEWLIEAAKALAGLRRSLRRERMAAYWQLLRSGLRE